MEIDMNTLISSESTLTERYQTTVPSIVRRALHLNKHDKLQYTIQLDGNVLLSRAGQKEDDPAIGSFLSFLANDIIQNPNRLHGISTDLVNEVQSLIHDTDIDLDSPLPETE